MIKSSYCPHHVDDIDKSNLYLKLFKLVFGSVTLFAQENEVMLKVPLLQTDS